MEEKINIAAILNDKPKGIRLYSPIFGECAFCFVREETDDICVKKHNGEKAFFDSKGLYNTLGEVMLFPSKEMRDWYKFAWKKGDVLVSEDNEYIIFEKFENDSYTTFKGKHYFWKELDEEDYSKEQAQRLTSLYEKTNNDDAQTYIKTIEEKLGGILNRETLEIEKTQPEFKDGDIVVTDAVPSLCYSKCVFILKGDLNTNENSANSYVFYNINNNVLYFNILDTTIRDRNIHLATEEEKKQLFDALEKEGKAWDAEKKEFIDLKPKVELNPFDKVLVRDSKSDNWRANLFGYIDKDGYYHCVYANWAYCIPYIGNESLLGTTKDVEG